MRISAALPHGVSALFADSARRRRALEASLVERLERAGFEEVVLPIVDYLEPYEPLLTPASRRELYQLIDRDGELLALRADFTPMLARLVAPRLESLDLPLAVYYRGDVVRFQEERPGRLRELYQLGAELLGVPGAAGEERMLRLFLEVVKDATRTLGGSDDARAPDRDARGSTRQVDVVLGVAGALDGLLDRLLEASGGEPPGQQRTRRELTAALARRDRDAIRRLVGRERAEPLLAVAEEGVPEDLDLLGEAAPRVAGLLDLRERLAAEADPAEGVRLTVDLAEFAGQTAEPSSGVLMGAGTGNETGAGTGDGGEDVVWGRSYYDGTVFRAYLGGGALPIGGGGRYDRLFRVLGAEVSAVGFSLGLDRLSQGLSPGPAQGPAQSLTHGATQRSSGEPREDVEEGGP